jgi:hypothetical protein
MATVAKVLLQTRQLGSNAEVRKVRAQGQLAVMRVIITLALKSYIPIGISIRQKY